MSSGGAARGAAEGRGACGQRAGGEARTTTGGWGRAAKGQAERQAPCAARKGGGVRKTGRRSRAPEKAAPTALLRPQTATCAHQQLSTSANDVPVLEKAAPTAPRARRQRLMPASGDLRHQRRPRTKKAAPTAPTRPPTALHVCQRCSRSRKAAPTAPSVHNRHPAPGKPYKQRPAPTNGDHAPKKPRRQRPAFTIGTLRRESRTNSDLRPPTALHVRQ